jgi:transcriptional regulator with XRE-family HTH domain
MPISARDFKIARQLTRHSQADVAKALGVERSTVARWESGDREAPEHVYEWLMLNRHQSFLDVPALTAPGEARGQALRAERAAFLAPFPEGSKS